MPDDLSHRHLTQGQLCLTARVSGWPTYQVCEMLGISRVTLNAWERTSDHRLVQFWRERGYPIETEVVSEVRKVGADRTIRLGHQILDMGVSEARTGVVYYRSPQRPNWACDEYAVDETEGIYLFQPDARRGRRMLLTYLPQDSALQSRRDVSTIKAKVGELTDV